MKAWSRECDALEADGKWAELERQVADAVLDSRWKAALARIRIFQGRWDEARVLLDELGPLTGLTPDARMLAHMARSTIARRDARLEDARVEAKKAILAAKKAKAKHLFADAQYNQALCLLEEGRIFLALDLFHMISAGKIYASPFRRGMAALSEAWLLWDIGQPEGVRRALPRIPAAFAERVEVCLAMLDGDAAYLRKLAQSGPARSETTESEKVHIASLLAEAAALWSLSDTDWVRAQAGRTLQSADDPITREKMRACIALLDGERYRVSVGADVGWRFLMELHFLEALSASPSEALEIYRSKIDPILDEHRIATPLIPFSKDLANGHKAWVRSLAQRLGLRQGVETETPRLQLQNGLLRLVGGGEIQLGKSPVSLRLLKILAGTRGRKVSKEHLHRELTGFKYSSEVHDDRLHKLLKRLSVRITKELGLIPWELPGDNQVVLSVDLEIT